MEDVDFGFNVDFGFTIRIVRPLTIRKYLPFIFRPDSKLSNRKIAKGSSNPFGSDLPER
jgi:hypothetical protein